MKNDDILAKLGFSENESKIYIALVNSGMARISDIVKFTGLHRPVVYKLIPKLEAAGFISTAVRGKQKHYYPESPSKLQYLAEMRVSEYEKMIAELKKIHNSRGKRPVVKFLSGRKGLTFILADILKTLKRGDIFYRYSSRTADAKPYLPPNFHAIRDRKQLQRFVISNAYVHETKKPKLNRAIKVVPAKYGLFDYNIAQIIYGPKVAFSDLNTETGIIIENKAIAEFQKSIYKAVYDNL